MQTEQLKKRLLEEKDTLERELSRLGRKMDGNHWEATEMAEGEVSEDMGENKAEETEMADQIEMFEERTSEQRALEVSYHEVMGALARMDEGSYGFCTIGGFAHPIEEARLEANPAAHTCMQHMSAAI